MLLPLQMCMFTWSCTTVTFSLKREHTWMKSTSSVTEAFPKIMTNYTLYYFYDVLFSSGMCAVTKLCLCQILTIYIRMSRIITIAVWWSFQAWFKVWRKLLFRALRTSSRTFRETNTHAWGGHSTTSSALLETNTPPDRKLQSLLESGKRTHF